MAGCSTPGTHERDLVPPGIAPAVESGVAAERSSGGSAIGSALCSRLLGGARLCSLLLDSDLGRWDEPQVGGVVVTILTSECSEVPRLAKSEGANSQQPQLMAAGSLGWCARRGRRSLAGLYGLAVAGRFWRGGGVRLLWSAGSALGSRSVSAGVVRRRSALLCAGLFADHAASALVSGCAWPSWHARGPGFESP